MRRLIPILLGVAIVVIVLVRIWNPQASPSSEGPSATDVERVSDPGLSLEKVEGESRVPEDTSAAVTAREPAAADVETPDLVVIGLVVGADGTGIADAVVAIRWMSVTLASGETQSLGSEDEPVAHAQTAADGTFRLGVNAPEGARVAAVWFACRLRGFASVQRHELLPEGQQVLDLGQLTLLPGATISGIVRDAEQQAIVGARVSPTVPTGTRGWGGNGAMYRTTAGGAFLIDDAATGPVRVSAWSEDSRTSDTVELSLQPGEVRSGIELVMPVYEDPSAISGIVFDVDGTTLSRATIAWSITSGSGGSTFTDENGRFRLQGSGGSRFNLTVSHPLESARPALLEEVLPGTHDLVVRLTEHVRIPLYVRGKDGKRIADFTQRVDVTKGQFRQTGRTLEAPPTAQGDWFLQAPVDTFVVAVTAPGFAEQDQGPFDPDELPAAIEFTLEPIPALDGRVIDGGTPVAGARVVALAALERGESRALNEFDLVADPCELCREATTGADGTFRLHVPRAGRWHVRASAAGRPTTLSTPVEIASDRNGTELVVDLTPRGAIEGRARNAQGAALARKRIEASCGNGAIASTRADAEGNYRFDLLAPGGWQVRLVENDDVYRGGTSSSRSGSEEAPPIAWDCHVENGKTTRFDIGLVDPIQLLVRIDEGDPNAPLTSWDVSADTYGLDSKSESVGARPTETPRVFALSLTGPGSWRVSAGLNRERTQLNLSLVVTVVVGANDLTLAVPRGSVRGRLRAPHPADARVTLRARSAEGADVQASVVVAPDGTFVFPFAFAGTTTLSVQGDRKRTTTHDVTAGASNDAGEL